MSDRFPQHEHSAASDPLWALVVILGEIAARVERHRAAEHRRQTPETQRAPGDEPGTRKKVA